jgi:hypothetical protein
MDDNIGCLELLRQPIFIMIPSDGVKIVYAILKA